MSKKMRCSVLELPLPIDERTAGNSKAVNLRNIVGVLGTIARLFWQTRLRRSDGVAQARSFRLGAKEGLPDAKHTAADRTTDLPASPAASDRLEVVCRLGAT